MKCNQICKWNSNVGCVKHYGVPCILENVSPTDKKATNADRIRAMSDEELAETLNTAVCPPHNKCNTRQHCLKCWIDWLKQPMED